MIIVIADDLTGATEIGGIGLRYGLKVEITSRLNSAIDAHTDLFVINTDTRSMSFETAMVHLSQVLNWIKKLQYSYIFKKVDSVLRGYVVDEINLQLAVTKVELALLIPANPRFGRTISKGNYYVHNKLINETDFANDPEFPIQDAHVLHMLCKKEKVAVKTWKEKFPQTGIVLGEAETEHDIQKWIAIAPSGALIAGGASSFLAFLQNIWINNPLKVKPVITSFSGFKKPWLYVCGSTFHGSVQRIVDWENAHEPVFYIPLNEFDELAFKTWVKKWTKEIELAISIHKKAIIAFDTQTKLKKKIEASYLRKLMAKSINALLTNIAVKELIVEGGATAGAILEHLQIPVLIPQEELTSGVIRCSNRQIKEMWITLKPGSYNWNIAMV